MQGIAFFGAYLCAWWGTCRTGSIAIPVQTNSWQDTPAFPAPIHIEKPIYELYKPSHGLQSRYDAAVLPESSHMARPAYSENAKQTFGSTQMVQHKFNRCMELICSFGGPSAAVHGP